MDIWIEEYGGITVKESISPWVRRTFYLILKYFGWISQFFHHLIQLSFVQRYFVILTLGTDLITSLPKHVFMIASSLLSTLSNQFRICKDWILYHHVCALEWLVSAQ
jgi:hypothetical protein